jgi:hypothetical protein
LDETAHMLERDVYRRLRPGNQGHNREWKRRCRGMAARVRHLRAQAAEPGGTTQEILQQEVIDLLVGIATGEWGDVPTDSPNPANGHRDGSSTVLSSVPKKFTAAGA